MSFVYNPPTEPFLNILYRDDDLIVCDKPSGLLSVRGKAKEHQDSLEARLQSVLPTVGIVHRLDMSTSGIMVMPLNKPAHSSIARQFQERETSKTYIANVWGKPKTQSGVIELPLICDWPNRPKQMVCFENGKPSTTLWRVLSTNDVSSRIELTPITGRSHQLRVHMLHLGHPILGDKFYAHQAAFDAAPRLNLHAQALSFTHPVTGKNLSFYSPAPF
ncbi:bifunctional tRNA pseudouridine(32) synthase/23S rRNA pseudouridine(746) synthase RluA [Catenovulum sp. SM1970]|uniref:bifunctional tRNA pseudouridine(32) synthase/23S rRNA pseudouridine(746) synthase RluA n=1 Tax=Marinifaba aquimaris TaxID=2741323 RepID=UPI001573C647|nr:bifunctional tRNA pseudouridine(32) synthase/23S rRNA pseudouridine(746) synthase RluA [Marinifaba aquimaris]NTS77440.1 bifunctional tRNA pseudouridine(32) synthase/23S rRNA pseudouridine(746) synthase RluA [Marinifaba aquimaris]